MKSVEEDERASVLSRRLFNNIIVAKLKNEREKERLNARLKGLQKQEERHLSHIQNHLITAQRELANIKAASSNKSDLEKYNEHGPFESLRDVYFLNERYQNENEKKNRHTSRDETEQRRNTRQTERKPMSFMELKRFPPKRIKENKMTISWPNPETMDRRNMLEFPPLHIRGKYYSKSLDEKTFLSKMKTAEYTTIKMPLPPVLRKSKNKKEN